MIQKIKRRLKFILISIDVLLIYFSMFLSIGIRFKNFDILSSYILDITLYTVIMIYLSVLYIMDLYNINRNFRSKYYYFHFTIAFIIISIAIASLFYMVPILKYGRGILFLQIIISFVLLLTWRVIYIRILENKSENNLAIIGCNEAGREIARIIKKTNYYSFAGFINEDGENNESNEKDYLGNLSKLEDIINKCRISSLVIAIEFRNKKYESFIINAKIKGIVVYNVPSIYEMIAEKLPVKYINDLWIIFETFAGIADNIYNNKLKRIFDILASICILIISAPIFLITTIAIKLMSTGPVFYRQIRVGLNGNNYEILKFRSMVENAEIDTGAVWAEMNDPRVTSVGRIIRKLRIDELPQLINTLKGDMSIIGPRPERPQFVNKLINEIPYYSLRHVVRPGITGWAQINYRYGSSVEDSLEKLQYDLYYIRHSSFRFDLIVFFKTIRTMLLLIGSR